MVTRVVVSYGLRAVGSFAGFACFGTIVLVASIPAVGDSNWALPAGQAGDWSAASNWGGQLPTNGNVATIDNGGSATISQPGELCSTLVLGDSAGTGGLQMVSGGLSAAFQEVGAYGAGSFTQSGGVNNAANWLWLGWQAGGSGVYNLCGSGYLSGPEAVVGFSGTGTFNQSGGTNAAGNLIISAGSLSSGAYNLSNGLLTTGAGDVLVGSSAGGAFTQTGGTVITSGVGVGSSGGGAGAGVFNLYGGQVMVTGASGVEQVYAGSLQQSGGTNTTHTLQLNANAGYSAIFSLSGGELSAASEVIGSTTSGAFTQSGGLNQSGTLTIAWSALSSGTYNMNGGTLTASAITCAGTGALNFNSGIIQASRSLSTAVPITLGAGGGTTFNNGGYSMTLAGQVSGAGGLTATGSGSLVLTASNIYTGGTTVSGGTLEIDNGSANTGYVQGNIADYAALVFDDPLRQTFSGVISGSGSLTNLGFVLTLANTNTFTGNTLIGSGTLTLGNPIALQDSTFDGSGSGVLNCGSLAAATFGGLTGSGTLSLSNTASAAVSLSVGGNNASTSYSGKLNGPGSLTKIGSGTLLLSATSTYSGPTTISQGKLTVDGWLTNSAVSVTGGTLGGTGHLSSVTVNPGGNLAPGDSLGTLYVNGNLILASSAVMDYELDTPTTSSLVSCSSLTLNGQQFTDFNFTWSSSFGPGVYDLIVAGSVPSGTLGSNTSGLIDGLPANLAVQGNDLALIVVVPEPSTLALLGAGILGLLGWAWRRRWSRGQGLRGCS